mgnify:CR=1 FL=1
MALQIKTSLFERQGKAITNFQTTLPESQSDLAIQTLKDLRTFASVQLMSTYTTYIFPSYIKLNSFSLHFKYFKGFICFFSNTSILHIFQLLCFHSKQMDSGIYFYSFTSWNCCSIRTNIIGSAFFCQQANHLLGKGGLLVWRLRDNFWR